MENDRPVVSQFLLKVCGPPFQWEAAVFELSFVLRFALSRVLPFSSKGYENESEPPTHACWIGAGMNTS